ncbi:spore coat protein [Longirhabdus pacifica]|uniref:spore coat protein n=1 Tax=Longirhabdus pacifica TaxID=2305227 RepID=UPI00100908AF|nr:spore coat protein [Longirhabdus pacifica]
MYNQYNQQQPSSMMQQGMSGMALTDKDFSNIILSEMKRTAREWTTACLESECPTVRELFRSKLNKTLDLQHELYDLMSQYGFYGQVKPAMQQDIQSQLHSQSDKGYKMHSFMYDHLPAYQQQMEQSYMPSSFGNEGMEGNYAAQPPMVASSQQYGTHYTPSQAPYDRQYPSYSSQSESQSTDMHPSSMQSTIASMQYQQPYQTQTPEQSSASSEQTQQYKTNSTTSQQAKNESDYGASATTSSLTHSENQSEISSELTSASKRKANTEIDQYF